MSEEKDIIKLESCPFCGDDQSSFGGMSEDAFASGSEGSLSVNCNCGALGPSGSTMTNAVAAWNTRTAASEITRLRGEAEAREVEIAALVESAREAQQLYVQADNEAQRLRGEVERLTGAREGWVLVPKVPTPAMLEQTAFNLCDEYGVAFVRPLGKFVQDAYAELLSSAPPPKDSAG